MKKKQKPVVVVAIEQYANRAALEAAVKSYVDSGYDVKIPLPADGKINLSS